MYFHVYLIYRFTRTFTDHSSIITRCWGFELQNGKSSLKSPQTLATQDFAPASFLSTPDKNHRNRLIPVIFFRNLQLFEMLNFRRFIKTHTLTHTGKGAESTGQGQTEKFLSGPVFSAHLLADDPADGVGGILLHLRRGVGVGVQREPR